VAVLLGPRKGSGAAKRLLITAEPDQSIPIGFQLPVPTENSDLRGQGEE
jgi:hypothetical protein